MTDKDSGKSGGQWGGRESDILTREEVEEVLRRRSLDRIEQEQENLRRLDVDRRIRMEEEQGMAAFSPRLSLARTPPGGFSAAPSIVGETADTSKKGDRKTKRPQSSPEEIQENQKRLARSAAGEEVPPLGGILSRNREDAAEGTRAAGNVGGTASGGLAGLTKLELMDKVHGAIQGIMGVMKAPNKLNVADKVAVSTYGQEVIAVVAALELSLAEVEHRALEGKARIAHLELELLKASAEGGNAIRDTRQHTTGVPTYAGCLKLANSRSVPKPAVPSGAVLAIYPTEDGKARTSEDTKEALKKGIDPVKIGVSINKLSKIGNGGVVVRTTGVEAVAALKGALPPGFRTTEPSARKPLVALRNMDGDPDAEKIIEAIFEQNLKRAGGWTMEDVKGNIKLAFKKWNRGRICTTMVFECSPRLRDAMMALDLLYIGWESIRAVDYVSVICCSKCQIYGHKERFCKAQEFTCGRCAESGHKTADCKTEGQKCATCTKFGNAGADSHRTASPDCPARKFAETRIINMTQYG